MAKEGTNVNIPINGITRNTSSTSAADGELEEIVNLRKKYGRYEPVGTQINVTSENIEYTQLYVHTCSYRHLLGVKNNAVYWFANLVDDEDSTRPKLEFLDTPVYLYNIPDISIPVKYTQTGNLLVINIENYYLFDTVTSAYSEKPLFNDIKIDVDFRLTTDIKDEGGDNPTVFYSRGGDDPSDPIAMYSEAYYNASEDGFPSCGYYLITAVLKLYDGSYIRLKNPVLLSPPINRTEDYVEDLTDDMYEYIDTNDDNINFPTEFTTTTKYAYKCRYASGYAVVSSLNYKILDSDTASDILRDLNDTPIGLFTPNSRGPFVRNSEDDYKEEFFTYPCIFYETDSRDTYSGKNREYYTFEPEYMTKVFTNEIYGSSGTFNNYYYNAIAIYANPNVDTKFPPLKQVCRMRTGDGSQVYALIPISKLQIRADLANFMEYEDIVQGVSIFMSKPIYDLSLFDKVDSYNYNGCPYHDLGSGGNMPNTFDYEDIYVNEPDTWDEYGYCCRLKERPIEDIQEEIDNTMYFYNLIDYTLSEANEKFNSTTWKDVDIDIDLNTITNQELLVVGDEGSSFSSAKVAFTYNGRLHLANYTSSSSIPNSISDVVSQTSYYKQTPTIYNKGTITSGIKPVNCYIKAYYSDGTESVASSSIFLNEVSIGGSVSLSKNSLSGLFSTSVSSIESIELLLQYTDDNGQKKEIYHTYEVTPCWTGLPFSYSFLMPTDTYTLVGNKYAGKDLSAGDYVTYDDKTYVVLRDIAGSTSLNILEPFEGSYEKYYAEYYADSVDRDGTYTYDAILYDPLRYIDLYFNDVEEFMVLDGSSNTEISSYPNKIRVSSTDNPLYFPAENTYLIGNSEIIGMAANSAPMPDGQMGASPLFVFSEDGIYGLFVDSSGELAYTNSMPISREACNNADSITAVEDNILFTTNRGLMALTGTTVQDMSDIVEGIPYKFFDSSNVEYTPEICKCINHTRLVELLDVCDDVNFLDYITNAIIGYNYKDKELWITNPDKNYSYVVSDGLWTKRNIVFTEFINDYPRLYSLTADGILKNVEEEEHLTYTESMFLTRPIKYGTLDFKQHIRSILRCYLEIGTTGNTPYDYIINESDYSSDSDTVDVPLYQTCKFIYSDGSVVYFYNIGAGYENYSLSYIKSTISKPLDFFTIIEASDELDAFAGFYILGSYDCKKWKLIGGRELKGINTDIGLLAHRVDCKYFRFLFVGKLLENSTIDFIDTEINNKLTANKLR